jgi:clan AA aspartic protease
MSSECPSGRRETTEKPGRRGREREKGARLAANSEIDYDETMGLVRAQIRLENPRRADLQPIEVEALADTGSLLLCIPKEVQLQLQLEPTSQKEVTTADGARRLCPYVGPIRVQFENRECYVGAVVLGDEVLLGAVPMEDMDLVVLPATRRVAVNPLHPNFASGPVK